MTDSYRKPARKWLTDIIAGRILRRNDSQWTCKHRTN